MRIHLSICAANRRRARRARPAWMATGGFTLIELMVVIVLIGITAAVIVPEMKGSYQDALLRSSSRSLVDSFNLAYSRAVSLNRSHRVCIDEKTGTYTIEMLIGSDGSAARFQPLKGVPGCEGKIDQRITVEFRSAPETAPQQDEEMALPAPRESEDSIPSEGLGFYADGTADAREVLLKDKQGFGLVLRLNPVTARVHVSELARK